MMRSLFSGVSGLRSHQTRMDVIGNNIANVNTTGYKSKTLNFSDLLYQTTQAATGPNAQNGTGGTNPRQIGLGVRTAAISTSITQEGSTQSTGNPFDLKISGEAFFVVSDGTNTFYTRDGAFDTDKAGNLVMSSTGYIVQGWRADDDGNVIQGSIGNINVMSKNSYGADSTKNALIAGIVDENDGELETEYGKQVNVPVFDAKGYEYSLKFGILPKTVERTSVVSTENVESEYKPAEKLFQVDTSELTYKDADNQELKKSSMPDKLLQKLQAAVWAYVNSGGTVNTKQNSISDFANYKFGSSESKVTVDLGKFIADDPDLTGVVLKDSELRSMTLTVNFSGGTGYTKGNNGVAPTYPFDSSSAAVIRDEVITAFYADPATITATNGVKTYTRATTPFDMSNVTVVKQIFADEKGDSTTTYIFKDNTNKEITAVADYPDDTMKLLGLGKPSDTKNQYTTNSEQKYNQPVTGEYTIQLIGMTDPSGKEVNIDPLKNSGTTSWDLIYNTADGKFRYVGSDGNKSFSVALSALNTDGNFSNLTVDMSDTTNEDNGGKSSLEGSKEDGRKLGTMTGVSIGTDGRITANYSNGMSAVLGQICVGTFPNAMGLENAGDNLYQVTANSGDVRLVDIKGSGTGSITTGVLEMSNVDLSQQFTDMITTQRGFQANSRIITVSDTLLEELVNIKR